MYYLKKKIYYACILVILISFTVYFNSLFNEFVWDDILLIERNEHLQDFGKFIKTLTKDFFFNETGNAPAKEGYYRPVITLSYYVDYKLWEKNPFGYHLTNLIFHTANSLLIFFIINELTTNFSLSLLTALVFSVHPVHSESVSWISGRTDVIAGFFYFLSLYCYIKFKKKKIHNHFFYFLSLTSFFLAVFSKEMALTLPFIIITFHYCFYTKKFYDLFLSVKLFIPYFLIVGCYFLLRLLIFQVSINAIPQKNIFTIILTFICRGLPFYLNRLFLPFTHNYYVIMKHSTFNFITVSIFLLSVLILVVIYLKIKSKIFKFFYLFFLLSLLPLTNIIRISTPVDMIFPVAERFIYIPSFAFFFILLYTIFFIFSKLFKTGNYPAYALIVSLLIFYSVRTISLNKIWKDNETFFLYAIKKTPASSVITENTGTYYFEKKDYETALRYYKKAIALEPPSDFAYGNMLIIYSEFNEYEKGIKTGLKGLKVFPHNYNINLNLALLYMDKKDFENSFLHLKRCISIEPKNHKGYYNLGLLFLIEEKFQKAKEYFLKSKALKSDEIETIYNLAYINFHFKKNIEAAKKYINKIFLLTDDYKKSYYLMTDILIAQKNIAEAEKYLMQFTEIFPDDYSIYNTIGMFYANHNNLQKALKYWKKYSYYMHTDWRLYNNIGTVYFKFGEYKQALNYFEHAQKISPDNNTLTIKINELKRLLNL